MPRLRHDRQRQRQLDALDRQAKYDVYVNDLLTKSSSDVAQKFFLGLSPSQQRRVFDDPAFRHLTWLVRLTKETSHV